MSIDAIVANTFREGNDLVIELANPPEPGRIAGADRLTVLDPHWPAPPPGTLLWGDAGVIMTPGNDRPVYRRVGYSRMRDDKDNRPPWTPTGTKARGEE